MSVETILEKVLTNPQYLTGWLVLMLVSLEILVWDLNTNNKALNRSMKLVWIFTVVYSGPFGLAGYWYSGRTQIIHDSLWRRGFRSVSHCYSGCGAGVVITLGLLALGNLSAALITSALAYIAGLAMTVGPLLQDGVALNEALVDGFYSATASLTVIESIAITMNLWLVREAPMGGILFWTVLVLSLLVGLLAAYPVNVLLVTFGVKESMVNPTMID